MTAADRSFIRTLNRALAHDGEWRGRSDDLENIWDADLTVEYDCDSYVYTERHIIDWPLDHTYVRDPLARPPFTLPGLLALWNVTDKIHDSYVPEFVI